MLSISSWPQCPCNVELIKAKPDDSNSNFIKVLEKSSYKKCSGVNDFFVASNFPILKLIWLVYGVKKGAQFTAGVLACCIAMGPFD